MNIRSINVTGRRWFQKSYGNTYNSVTIEVFTDDGERQVINLPKAYGYGDYYLQRATDELERLGFMPEREHYPNGGGEPAWRYFRDNRNIPFTYQAIDVSRQRDL